MMKRTFAAASAALALAVFAACAPVLAETRAEERNFSARGLDGNAYTRELLGDAKLTVFNVWGTFCPPCLRELPDLGDIAREMKDDGVRVVGLLCDWTDARGNESATQIAKARAIADMTKADYLHLLLNEDVARFLGCVPSVVPQTYFVTRDGEVLGTVVGARSGEEWREMIRAALTEAER